MKRIHSLLGCLILLCLLCSCQTFSPSTPTTSQATAKATPTLADLMQKSLAAMNTLKSVHANDVSTIQLIVNRNQAPTPTPLNQIQLTPFNTGIAQYGDIVLPDQSSFHITAMDAYNADQELYNFLQVHLANNVYFQKNTQTTWYQLPSSSAVDPTLPGQMNPLDLTKQLLTFNSNVQFQDLGSDTADNGAIWHRISVKLNKEQVLKLISSQAIAPGAIEQRVQELLSQPAVKVDGSMDFNFDTKTLYVQNEDLSLHITVMPKNIQEYSTDLSFMHTIDFTRFNDPSITISAPSDTIPAPKDMSSILASSSAS